MKLPILVITGVSVLICGSPCAGGDGAASTHVYGKPSSGQALSVDIDTTWVAGEGYRPVRVSIRPMGKPIFVRDRQVTLQVSRYHRWTEFPREITEVTIDLPEGAAEVGKTIYVQQNRIQSNTDVYFWEGRRRARNVQRFAGGNRNKNPVWNEAVPSILIVDYDVPSFVDRLTNEDRFRGTLADGDADGLDDRIPNAGPLARGVRPMVPQGVGKGTNKSWVDVSRNIANCEYVTPKDLPEDWIGLSGVDIIYMDVGDLRRMQTEDQNKWSVVDAWLRAGGMIWIVGAGGPTTDEAVPDVVAGRKDVETLLRIPAENEGSTTAQDAWQVPPGSGYGEKLDEFAQQENYQWVNGAYVQATDTDDQPAEKGKRINAPFAFRSLQLGTVVIWNEAHPLAEEDRWLWEWTFRSLSPSRWMWSQRNGVSMFRDNDEFFRFLIPGVGLAPVNSFRVIMTLFVLVIGPLNYTVLHRWKRLNWMLFTVPACALLVTIGLMNYALVTDGVSVRARNRSLTVVDQLAGHATTWSRQAYYAGIAPSQGLVFPTDVTAYPISFSPLERMAKFASARELSWDDDQQNLAVGYLTSRNTAQFLVQRSRASSMGLTFLGSESGLEQVTNRLRGDIQSVLVRAADDVFYSGANIADGTKGSLRGIETEEVRSWLNENVREQTPVIPKGVRIDFDSRQNYQLWEYRNANNHLGEPTMAANRSNRIIAEWCSTGRLPSGSYLAVMKACGEVPLGVPSPREVDSFYLVFGRFLPTDTKE